MKISTTMDSFLVERLLEILASFIVSNENYDGLHVLEYQTKKNPCLMVNAIEEGKLISFQPICHYFQIREAFLVTSYVTKKFLLQFYYF